MKPANLSAKSPRLSTSLPGPRSIHQCQSCGASDKLGLKIRGWAEHDHNDQPEPFSVWLCEDCETKLIEPHPRLYRRITDHEPFPGAMPLCLDCKRRDGVTCMSPKACFNGGPPPGIKMEYPKPSMAHLNLGRKGGRWQAFYHGPVTSCSGKELC
jgi:hypothetical protein